MNTSKIHKKASSTDTQSLSFSFCIAGISLNLNPKLIIGNSHDRSSQKLEQSCMEVQKRENGQNKVVEAKEAT